MPAQNGHAAVARQLTPVEKPLTASLLLLSLERCHFDPHVLFAKGFNFASGMDFARVTLWDGLEGWTLNSLRFLVPGFRP
jgi:hypothetical protein